MSLLFLLFSSGKPTVHVGHRVSNYAVAIFLQQSSPYKDPMNRVLERLLEAGITNKVLDDALSRIEVKEAVQGPDKLDFRGTVPAFVALTLFGAISVVVATLECFQVFTHHSASKISGDLHIHVPVEMFENIHYTYHAWAQGLGRH